MELYDCTNTDILNITQTAILFADSYLVDIDSLDSRSAALMVAGHHDGPQGVINWLKSQDIDASEIDPDGKHILIRNLLELRRWKAAYETANALTENDLVESPVLHFAKAMSYLLSTVPVELRHVVISQVPFEAASLSLDSSKVAIDARRTAFGHFVSATEVAEEFHCPRAAAMAESYAHWLELEDPEIGNRGRKRLAAKLDELKDALHLVPLGIQYGIPLDQAEVEQEIERQVSSGGGIALDMAFARLALARMQERPKDIANYISCHYDMLSAHLDAKAIRSIQIEMLAKAGLPELANEYLEELREEGLSEVEEGRLRIAIEKAEGKDTLEAQKALFELSGSIVDLEALVNELGTKSAWNDLCKYEELLFEKTHSLQDAERLTNVLHFAGKFARVIELLESYVDILSQSANLQMCYCWALYHEGELLKARSELAKLGPDSENANYRELQVSIGVALEDWDTLSTFVANEYRQKDNRSAQEMIRAAQLSQHWRMPLTKQLLFEATKKGQNDPKVLTSAYSVALKAGWENEEKVVQWLSKAAELSGNDGPIQKVTLTELISQLPEWDRQASETWQQLKLTEIPFTHAAEKANKPLSHLMLFTAHKNFSERDPRRTSGLPAFSGGRQPLTLPVGGTVGIDFTTILTLGLLDLLDTTINAFETVYLPHSTLEWLIEEEKGVAFQQPSRLNSARQAHDLIAEGKLEAFPPNRAADRALSSQVGHDLAVLIAEAESKTYKDMQRLVVRSSPVIKVDAPLGDEADLTGHTAVVISCQAVVEKLRQKGLISASKEQDALNYFRIQLHEKPWPNQTEITDTATLYLDDPAVISFLHLGILEELCASDFRLIVSPSMISEVNRLIRYDYNSSKVINTIERLRPVIKDGIELGRIKVGKLRNFDEGQEQSMSGRQIDYILDIAEECDAIIVDDRFFNQHPLIEQNDTIVSFFTTLDLLDALESSGHITHEAWLEYRTALRRAGYSFVPVTPNELTHHLNADIVTSGVLNESLELKAIRENILLVRMSDWLQLPEEATWPDMTEKALVRALRALWRNDIDVSVVTILSNWIIDQLDIENGDNILKNGRGDLILVLLVPPPGASQEIREEYRNWAEKRILAPFKEHFADLYTWIVANYRTLISEFVNKEQREGSDLAELHNIRALAAQAMLNSAPSLLRETLLEDEHFWDEFGLKVASFLTFEDSGVSFQRSELYDAIRQTFMGASDLTVTDTKSREWRLSNKDKEKQLPVLVLFRGSQRIRLNLAVLASDSTTRLSLLELAGSDVNLPLCTQQAWRKVFCERVPEDEEVEKFYGEISDTPVHIARSIRSEINEGTVSVSTLVPGSRRYYDRLVGVYDESGSVREYAERSGREFIRKLSEWRPYDGFLFSLLLSSHSSLTTEISVEQLDSEDLVRAFGFLEKCGDRLSQLGAIEVSLRVLPDRPEIKPVLVRLLKQIRDDDAETSASGFKLLSELFLLVDGELSRTRLFSEMPPFYRRMAALSQSALICRQFGNASNAIDSFCKWAAASGRGGRHHLQSLADMRLEPRWYPNYSDALQVKSNFYGRIVIAASNCEQNIKGDELHDLILGEVPGSILSLCEFPRAYFPGPLEGTKNSLYIMLSEISAAIEAQLGAEEIGLSSLAALLLLVPMCDVEFDQAKLVAKVRDSGNTLPAEVEERSQLLSVMFGLASVAAVARNHALADEIRILVRNCRQDDQYKLSIEEILRISLVAAASREDQNDWIHFVGECLTELAFGELEDDDRDVLHTRLQYLCHAVPELWVFCSRADAALKALRGY